MNKEQMAGKWHQFAGEAKKQWGKLTDDQWTQIKGDSEKLSGQIQEAYGLTKENAEKEIKDFEARTCNSDCTTKNRAA